ncbi:MAG: hypothetical protein ACKPBA_01170 [Planctomycetota bacterium]
MLRRNANALAAASALLAALPAVAQVEPPDITPQQPSSAPARPEPVSASTAGEGDVANPPAAVTTIPQQPAHSVGGGYLHQFSESAGDNGGSMSADRFYASFSSRMVMSDELTLTLAMGYEFDWYHWSGASPFTVQDPWGSVNLFGLQLRGSFKVAKDWTATVGGIFAMAGETNADAGDRIYGGGIVSVAWTPTQDLMLGLGVLGVTQLEDDPLIIPIPVVHWHFAEEWELSTIRRPPASPFVGIDVAWEPVDSKLDVAFGIGWQQRRFRLGTTSSAASSEGVGQDQSWAAFASVGYDFAPNVRVDFIGGLTFYEKLQLVSTSGAVQDATVDPNPLLGVFATVSF